MGSIDPTGLDRPVQIDDAWIGALDQGFGWNDKPRNYRPLNAGLHAIRESLPADERADPGAGFPVRPLLGDFLEEGLLMLNQRVPAIIAFRMVSQVWLPCAQRPA